jgi:hypothetical protein
LEDPTGAGKGLESGKKDALKFYEGFFKKGYVVKFCGLYSPSLEAELDRLAGKVVIVLFAREALFFGGRDDLPRTAAAS